MRKTIVTAMLLLSLVGHLWAGEIHKWVDEHGIVHYSDKPPQDIQTAEIVIPEAGRAQQGDAEVAPQSDAPIPAESAWYDQWLEQQRERKATEGLQWQQESAARRAAASERLSHCSAARQRLELLRRQCPVFYDGQGVLRVICPNQAVVAYAGEHRYIDDAERAAMIREDEAILEACSTAGY